jgi:hypothetical protein
VSLKSAKKSRKSRHSPYSRPTLPTPTSPSEVDYEPVLVGSVKFSNIKTGFANPIDLTMEDDNTPQASPTFPSTEKMEMEYVIPMQLTMRDDTPMGECTTFSTGENVAEEAHVATTPKRQDTTECETQDFSPIDEPPQENEEVDELPQEKEEVEATTIKEPETWETMSFENCEAEPVPIPEISPPPNTPLSYGDLVVVDYAEKRKVYKWPAIVRSLSLSF